jgi:small-conductance mechanosensitive channel
MPELSTESLRALLTGLAMVAAGALAGAAAAVLLVRFTARLVRGVRGRLDRSLREHLTRPSVLLGLALGVRATLPGAGLGEAIGPILEGAVTLVVIVCLGWIPVAVLAVVDAWLDVSFSVDERDNLAARRIHTKFQVIRRIVVIVVGILALGAALFTIPGVRHVGAGILASAGVAGLAVGLAARPTIETLLAGVQLALTEPINLDDVVIVEGEWGRIEEIRATYVVVRIWDLRRLVVPVQWFLQQPFQNWTRVTADLLGTVTVEVDYRAPVDEIRQAAGEIVASCEQWDRSFWNLQVVEAGERSIRLRVLVSARESSEAWDLRCEIREKLLAWLQEHHPEALPRLRVEDGAETSSGTETRARG